MTWTSPRVTVFALAPALFVSILRRRSLATVYVVVAIIDSWESYMQVVKYHVLSFDSTNIFLIASIVLLTIGSGYLARAWMHYSDAAENDAVSQEMAACGGCLNNNQIIYAYTESLRTKMQVTLQDMIFNAGIGIMLFSMGAGFSMVYFKLYRKTEPLL